MNRSYAIIGILFLGVILTTKMLPKKLPGLGPVKKIATGLGFNVVLQKDGIVKAWGTMSYLRGTLAPFGDDTFEPVTITGLGQVSDLSVLDKGIFAFAKD